MHLYLASVWGGGASSLFAIHCLYIPPAGPELYGRNLALLHVDTYILLPAAAGCLISGLAFCQLTGWGRLRYRWMLVKLTANVFLLLSGFFWFMPSLDQMAKMSLTLPDYLETDPTYAAAMRLHMLMAAGQALLVLLLVAVSVLKPWGRIRMR